MSSLASGNRRRMAVARTCEDEWRSSSRGVMARRSGCRLFGSAQACSRPCRRAWTSRRRPVPCAARRRRRSPWPALRAQRFSARAVTRRGATSRGAAVQIKPEERTDPPEGEGDRLIPAGTGAGRLTDVKRRPRAAGTFKSSGGPRRRRRRRPTRPPNQQRPEPERPPQDRAVVEGAFRRVEGIQREIELLPRMAGEQGVADGHRRESLCDQVVQGVVVALALAHRGSVHEQVLAVVPVARKGRAVAALALGDLVFVMGKEQVHAAGVQVDRVAEDRLAHRAALDVPARPALRRAGGPGPLARRRPLGLLCLPEREIAHVVLMVGVEGGVGRP